MAGKVAGIALLVLASFSTHSYAGGIGGWGYTITGSALTANLDLYGAGNPDNKPSVAKLNYATMEQIEYLCVNPQNHDVMPGNAGFRQIINISHTMTSRDFTGKGQATVYITFDLPGFAPIPTADPDTDNKYCSEQCVNPNWKCLAETDAAKKITTRLSWYACTGKQNDPDDDPCKDGNVETIATQPYDSVEGVCTIDPVLRNSDGTVVLQQKYTCSQTSP